MHRFCIPRTPWHCKELLGDRGKTWQLADFISVVNLDAMALEEGHVVWPTAAVYDARWASWPAPSLSAIRRRRWERDRGEEYACHRLRKVSRLATRIWLCTPPCPVARGLFPPLW